MSETVHHKGRLLPVFVGEDKTLEEKAKAICLKEGYKFLEFLHDNYLECLRENAYRDYFVMNNEIYKVDDNKADDTEVFNMSKNNDGSYNYELVYYNGGGSFDEALECAAKENGYYES